MKSQIIVTLLLAFFGIGTLDAQKLKGLKSKLKKVAEPEQADQDTASFEPSFPTDYTFYSEVEASDNFREKERLAFGSLYDFDKQAETVQFAGYDEVESSERNKKNKENLARLKKDFPNLKYRRSSLYTLMVHNEQRPHWNVIAKSFGNSQIPEKFNDHNVGEYLISTDASLKDMNKVLDHYITENQVAKKLVARWFNRSEKGGFDMNLIAERGLYNASDLDVKVANSSARGKALLADAGEELIGNTFVVINDYRYLNASDAAKLVQQSSKAASLLGDDALSGMAEVIDEAGSLLEGYAVLSTSHLYRLEWNDSISGVFYKDYWTDDDNLDPARKQAFDESTLFSLKRIGKQLDFQIVTAIISGKSEPELIEIATIKATDKAIAKLQRNYPEFQTKVPLYSNDPLTAKIGKKEGIKAKDKFEVLEQVLGNDGRTSYKRRATLTVDGEKIWDNTYLAGESNISAEAEESEGADEDESVVTLDATHFTGKGDKLYPGMLLRQIK